MRTSVNIPLALCWRGCTGCRLLTYLPHDAANSQVRYDILPQSSLNNRFWPLAGIRTEGVLSLDDDILAPCSALHKAFQAWKQNKYNLVGLYPRLHRQLPDCRWV